MAKERAAAAGRAHEEFAYWLALTFVKDIGPLTVRKLVAAFGSPKRIFEAGLAELKGIPGIGEARARSIREFQGWRKVEQEAAAARERGIAIVTLEDPRYPAPLKQLEDAPIILYIKGRMTEEDRYAVAMVGSRDLSEYGRKIADTIAYGLAARGLTVVSGMARGIDTVSHQGALKAGGRSIAVLGTGLDRPYPSENRELFAQLCERGAVLSEFPLGTAPLRENFPKRNRLISGLSLGVVIVEATSDSGSLITANYALEQGREVFAVPGSVLTRTAEGTNSLIRKGARLVQRAEDIIEELAPVLRGLLTAGGRREGAAAPSAPAAEPPAAIERLAITAEEQAICNVLGDEPRHIDTIARELKLPAAKLLALLLSLEIKGIVKQTEGKNFYIL